jgi:DNA repair exonuclease SbcCD ATPase subunit
MDTNNQVSQTNTSNDEKILDNSGVEIIKQENTDDFIPKVPTSTPAPIQNDSSTNVDIKQLEEQFQTEIGKPILNSQKDDNSDLDIKIKELEDTKNSIVLKTKNLNDKVKKELEDLKKMKEGIGDEIKKMGELKEADGQISKKIEDIKKLEEDKAKIEKEVNDLKEDVKNI